MPSALIQFFRPLNDTLTRSGAYLSGLVLRLFLAWEFAELGISKLSSGNWFGEIRDSFPFPFNLLPSDFTWYLATGSELLGAALLIIGFGTRYISIVLLALTLVAWYSLHAGYGYNVCSNGYKMALIYSIALVPLITTGAGKLSVDYWLATRKQA